MLRTQKAYKTPQVVKKKLSAVCAEERAFSGQVGLRPEKPQRAAHIHSTPLLLTRTSGRTCPSHGRSGHPRPLRCVWLALGRDGNALLCVGPCAAPWPRQPPGPRLGIWERGLPLLTWGAAGSAVNAQERWQRGL